MAINVDYEQSTSVQRVVAAASCVIVGGIILILGICGAFGDSETLPKMGFDLSTVVCYSVVVICGFLILARLSYSVIAALIAMIIEIVIYVTHQMSSTPDVGFLVLLKGVAIVGCLQLAIKIVSFSDEPEAPAPRRIVDNGAPRGRQIPNRAGARGAMPNRRNSAARQAPVARTRSNVGRNQPPQPRR